MKLVFMGTPEFAVPALQTLSSAHEVCAVITAPDKPAGRGKKVSVSAIKESALALDIPVLQPTNLKDTGFIAKLSSFNADLFVVVAFRMLPEVVWSMPPKGTINLHASLLPDYRGAAPINRAIMDGQVETGLTTFFIEKDIDTGEIIEQVKMEIGPNENAGSLHDRMMNRGAQLLLSTVNSIALNTTTPKSQKERMASMEEIHSAPKIFKEDCEIDWAQSAASVHNHVRGLSPYPGAWTSLIDSDDSKQVFKLFETAISDHTTEGSPGTVKVVEGKMLVKAAEGWLEIIELQAPGKKRMRAADFLRGYRSPSPWAFS